MILLSIITALLFSFKVKMFGIQENAFNIFLYPVAPAPIIPMALSGSQPGIT